MFSYSWSIYIMLVSKMKRRNLKTFYLCKSSNKLDVNKLTVEGVRNLFTNKWSTLITIIR
jgi:hypothetical protein